MEVIATVFARFVLLMVAALLLASVASYVLSLMPSS